MKKTIDKRFNAIIFDMDGVIVDSEPIHLRAELATCKKFGIMAPISEWDRFRGWTSVDIFTYLIKHYGGDGLDPAELAVYKSEQYLRIAAAEVRPIPGAIGFIRRADKAMAKVALATSSKKIVQEFIFERYGLAEFFDEVITGDDVRNGKPDPEIYMKAVERLGMKAEECLVVEDADNGIVAAKKAGCFVVGISTSMSSERLLEAGADAVVENFKQMII